MRIAIGGIVHETNTFAVESSGYTELDDFGILRGQAMLDAHGVRTFLGGMVTAASDLGHEIVPIMHAMAQPSGTIDHGTYSSLKAELIEGIAAALPVDAVVIDTHGAGVVDGIDDLEADLGAAIKTVVGPDVPLVTTLDLHGSISAEMNEVFDVMLGVYDYPHVDMYERGVEAIETAAMIVTGELRPTTHVERLPMLLPTSTTLEAPAGDIRQLCLDLALESTYVRGAFFHGFPYTDIPTAGASVVVTTHDDPARALEIAQRIAAVAWERRNEFHHESVAPEVAIRQALTIVEEQGGPVVMNDTADNTGGGAPGDATHVLRALLEAAPQRTCFGFIFDPAVANQALQAGAGSTISVSLGGKHDELHGAPVDLDVYVKVVSDGEFVYTTPMLAGLPARLGPMARLQVGGPGGLDVLVGSKRSQVFDAEVFSLHGIDVTAYDLVVLKSSQHFRAGFGELSTAIVTADSPGLTTLRVEHFDFVRVDGPRWPHDPSTEWAPGL